MKKKLIKRLEELAIENHRLRTRENNNSHEWSDSNFDEEKQSIPDSSQDLKEEPKEEVWWMCIEQNLDTPFTKGKKYKQIGIETGWLNLINDNGKVHTMFNYNKSFTKIEENKEL